MDTRELFFEDCRVPETNLLGEEGKGLRNTLTGMDLGRIVFASASIGLAQACLDIALAHAKQRVQFGQPIGRFQSIQFQLADLATEVVDTGTLNIRGWPARPEGSPRLPASRDT